MSSSLDIMSENQDIEKQKTIVKETAITFLGGTIKLDSIGCIYQLEF